MNYKEFRKLRTHVQKMLVLFWSSKNNVHLVTQNPLDIVMGFFISLFTQHGINCSHAACLTEAAA
jgi:hypothetical protein